MKYSICIRTLGTAGEKFERLMESIKELEIKPKEVIVVIPKGYSIPKIDLEIKRIVISEKGMLLQRIIGIEEASTEYVLLLDDDIEFERAMVNKLYEPIKRGMCKISFPIYKDLLLGRGIRRTVSALTLSSIPKKYKQDFVKIINSGGFTYNSDLHNAERYLYSESAPGMCVFGERDALIKSNLRNELWIDKTQYPLREDAVLIYKNNLIGNKIMGVQGIAIEHLDAGSSENNRNLKSAYANCYNHILFWKRFIYDRKTTKFEKAKCKIAINYWRISIYAYHFIVCGIRKDKELFRSAMLGVKDGFKKISDENIWE